LFTLTLAFPSLDIITLLNWRKTLRSYEKEILKIRYKIAVGEIKGLLRDIEFLKEKVYLKYLSVD